MTRTKTVLFGTGILALAAFGCTSTESAGATAKNEGETVDKSITLAHENFNEYGTKMAQTKKIEVKADTSTSIVADWRNDSIVSVPEITASEEYLVYKTGEYTDGYHAGEPLDLHMDIFYQKDAAPQPVVLFIPGGGFIGCDAKGSLRLERQYLAEHGYAVASIEYHVVGSGLYRDAVQDIKDAMQFLRANAEKYNLDADNLAIMGNSAGGYMTALFTAIDSSGVKAAIDLYGLSDLTKVGADYDAECLSAHLSPYSSESQFVNGVLSGKTIGDDEAAAADANPLTHIDGNECPMLIMHGDSDTLVSPSQSLLVHNAINAAGGKSVRYSLVGAEHGRGGFNTESALGAMTNFLGEYLK